MKSSASELGLRKVITFCVEKLLHFALNTLLHFASMLLHFALVLHFAAIVITFCVSITFCGDYYILRRNKDYMLVQFGNNWIQKIPRTSPIWQSSEFFSSNYFQIGQHVVLLHIQIANLKKY